MENKKNRRVLIDPLLLVLKSRRVLIAIASLLIGLLVMNVPQLEALHSELLVLVVSLALALIGGLSVEDAVIAAKQTPVQEDVRQLVEAAIDAVIDEMLLETEKNLWRSGDIEDTGPDYSPN